MCCVINAKLFSKVIATLLNLPKEMKRVRSLALQMNTCFVTG